MKHKRNILLIILIVSSLGLILFPKSVIGSIADIHYTFENDVIYENNSIELQDSFNLRNPTIFTEEYFGSYTFTNETVGTNSTDIRFVDWDNTAGDCLIEIQSDIDGHSKILSMFDNDAVNRIWFYNDFADQISGTIEFWIRANSNSDYLELRFYQNSGTHLIRLVLRDTGQLSYIRAGFNDFRAYSANIWYHIRLDFETGAGGYLGLGADKMDLYVNGFQELSNIDFENAGNNIARFYIISGSITTDNNYNAYLDGIGYTARPNYDIGKNMLPITITDTSTLEVDRYEFSMSDIDTFHATGADNPNGWIDVEDPSGDKVGIAIQGNVNGLVYSSTTVLNDIRGIQKDFSLSGIFLNITVGFIAEVLDGNVNQIYFHIDSSDSQPITKIRIQADLDIAYKDDTGYQDLASNIVLGSTYDFNIFINYELDRVFLILKKDDVIIEIIDYTTIVPLKEGIKDIQIWSINDDDNEVSYYIDYVGLYIEGVSQVGLNEDFGLATRDLIGLSNWNYEHNNLFNIIANGNFHLGVIDGSVYSRASTLLVLKDTFNYISETSFLNLYDAFISVVSIPKLVFTLVSGLFNVSYIKIDGCKLIQNSNEYFLQYSHSGIDTNESYFYVDINNKLQFSLISNDTDTEYIQATFNITNIVSTDKGISFRGYRINKAYGYFVVDFLNGITTVEIPILEKTTRTILPTNKTIDTFVILITDNDIDYILGTTTGFVSQPILLSISGIGLPIITAGLIEMMIPLLLIMIPTLLISNGFGIEGKKLIIPLFLVFSLIATITEIIPIWIFFIIAFGNSLFLFRNKEIEG